MGLEVRTDLNHLLYAKVLVVVKLRNDGLPVVGAFWLPY